MDNPNSHLIKLLKDFNTDPVESLYWEILEILQNGSSFLLLPSVNETDEPQDLTKETSSKTLNLASVFDMDGGKVLCAFSNLDAMNEWTKNNSNYTKMRSKDVLNFCQVNQIDKIIIDTEQDTMFMLERETQDQNDDPAPRDSNVEIGFPKEPLPDSFTNKLTTSFAKEDSILEVYNFAMIRGDEYILVLAFKLESYDEVTAKKCASIIQNSLNGEDLTHPLEMFFLDSEELYKAAKDIEGSKIY